MVRYDDISDGIGGRDAKDPERESRDWDVIQKQYPRECITYAINPLSTSGL